MHTHKYMYVNIHACAQLYMKIKLSKIIDNTYFSEIIFKVL
jgi:hypothetical protein